MIVTHDNERLYPTAWVYNASRIMSELARIIINNGGRVKPLHTAIISDRSRDKNQPEQEPITVTHTTYISFILDNSVYYYQVDDNPFFPFYHSKKPLRDGEYSLDACCDDDKKEWLFDCLLRSDCPDSDITTAANTIFNQLKNSPYSHIWHNYKRGTGREHVKSDRIAKIDF